MLMPHLDSHARVLLLICFSLGLVLLLNAHSKSQVLLPKQFIQVRQKDVQKTLHGANNADPDLLRDVLNSTLGVRLLLWLIAVLG